MVMTAPAWSSVESQPSIQAATNVIHMSLQNLLPREQSPIGARHNMVVRQVIPWEKLVNKLHLFDNLCDNLNIVGELHQPIFKWIPNFKRLQFLNLKYYNDCYKSI